MKPMLAATLMFALGVWAQAPARRSPAPAAVRYALGADASLLDNDAYLAPYPALSSFVKAHPDVARDPGFYLDRFRRRPAPDTTTQMMDIWREVLQGAAVFGGF